MSGINDSLANAVTMLNVKFVTELGDEKNITCTAFAIATDTNRDVLVTNKHNLDPSLKLGVDTPYRLHSIQVLLRKRFLALNGQYQWMGNTAFYPLPSIDHIIHSADADVSIIYGDYSTEANVDDFGLPHIFQSEIATEDFFADKLKLMDVASFIGYPGKAGIPWWNTGINYPIARTVNIASSPHLPFTNPSIITTDVILVSGLSFSGSSGSVVVSHQKGYSPISSTISFNDPNYAPPRLIGIMSGHWSEKEQDAFVHTGLSYLTRSTSILSLIASLPPFQSS